MKQKLNKRIFTTSFWFLYLVFCTITFVITYGQLNNPVINFADSPLSGVVDNVVYVNNLEADYYYYKGLNYTESSTGTLPSGNNQNIYPDNKLVEVAITYSGVDINGGNRGYVSLGELQDTYIYYKISPIFDNGTSPKDDDYIEIELIENPFTNRPTDKGFNGWVTDYLGAQITYNSIYYVRTAKIPVNYVNDNPQKIEITFNASWTGAAVSLVNGSRSWSTAFNSINAADMYLLNTAQIINLPVDMTGYFEQVRVSLLGSCTGYYDASGNYQSNCRCSSIAGCTYYRIISGGTFNSNNTYYELINNYMYQVNNSQIEVPTIIEYLSGFSADSNMAGYFRRVNIPRYSSIVGYYNNTGVLQTSGTCNTSSGCIYYELIQYYNSNGNPEILDINTNYYYLATRDTNIIVMTGNLSNIWGSSQNKPFTLTSISNGIDYRSSVTWSLPTTGAINCYNDTSIENIRISSSQAPSTSTPPSNTTTARVLYGRWNNVKIGRGLIQSGSYVNFVSILGGSNSTTGSSSNYTKYRLIIESGLYSTISIGNGSVSFGNNYVEARAIYGNDYDRVTNNNQNLRVNFCASGSWGGVIYASSTEVSFDLIVKSGSFGTSRYDYTTGIYVGGRQGGTHNSPRRAKIEGGWIYNLIGGPLTASNRSNYNDSYINVTGGEVDVIIGGAGTTATYGHRIIQVTGGTINYSIFGGSNGYQGSDADGTVVGSSFIYIGGNAVVGNPTYVSQGQTIYGAETGSVFGIGNGRSGYSTIGSSSNSNIIIADEAVINQNVYGGGNYGATGISSGVSSTVTNITMNGGTVKGSIYGGGNNNGSGSSSIQSTINIKINGGQTEGSVYGGSNVLGSIFGNINLDVIGGTFIGSIYGGGRGGYTNTSNPGTYVSGNINVTIGENNSSPLIHGNLYGGSAYGSVNATTQSPSPSSNGIFIAMNNGEILGNLFGGSKGDANFVPRVAGNVRIDINNGKIFNLFGGNDITGQFLRNSTIYLNGGVLGNVYGGGNQVESNTPTIYLQGSNVTNLFGGSNISGNVTKSTINTTSGNVTNLYGGNNAGGKTIESNILINGANIQNLYGGGKLATTDKSIVNLNNGVITNAYGGGENANITIDSNIQLNGANVTNLFGGSNISGNVPKSTITVTSGSVNNLYGGNNAGGKTTETSIVVNGANIQNLYGGGKLATTDKSIVNLNNGVITSAYGGGESASITIDSNIQLNGANVTNLYGGSNVSGDVPKSLIKTISGKVTNLYGGNNAGGICAVTNIEIEGSAITNVYGGGNYANTTTSNILVKSTPSTIASIYGGGNNADVYTVNLTITNGEINQLFGGSNFSGTVNTSNILINEDPSKSIIINEVYGGNNIGGTTTTTNLNITGANINNVYGGGNEARVNNNTYVNIKKSQIAGNVYGGGNEGTVGLNTIVEVTDSIISKSIYAGGNGVTATVEGNTLLNVEGTTAIGQHVFGGGNAAATGTQEDNNSRGIVNISGANIGGNVYGGANTSVLYGTTEVNIGYGLTDYNLINNNINIAGTVFGGGEANASGDEIYDYSFISVTKGIIININGNNQHDINILGSIFGSGNASSTIGYSLININKYGTKTNHKRNISIQRADVVTLNNSFIELYGATDRTNEYSTTLFTLSRIKELKLKNNSMLYLETGANLLEKVSSLVDINGNEEKGTVTILENGNITKNVDNRIYMIEGKNLNIATNESVTSYGEVNGMTFFGMYNRDRNGNVDEAFYSSDYNYGDNVSIGEFYHFSSGSYVLGRHGVNHDIQVDGFYTNYENENNSGTIDVLYITPTPESSNYYMWIIGEAVSSYDISITASKYSTLGTCELPLINSPNPNTIFSIVGVNFNNLVSDFQLVKQSEIPRISKNGTADTKMSLVMKTSNTGWVTVGETNLLTDEDNPIYGTTDYISENSSVVPSLLFYIYHSKNLTTSGNIGTITISLLAITPIDDLTNEVERININIDLSRVLYTTNDYEGAMTSGEEHDMFVSTLTDVTSTSKLSAYYSLYVETENSIYKQGDYRALVSSFVFPANTKFTMIDLTTQTPTYYYYVVTEADVIAATNEYSIHNEASYELSRFVRMGSSSLNNNYKDSVQNNSYYDPITDIAHEEFVFIVDFAESNIQIDKLNNSLLIELRNSKNQTLINVLGIQHANLNYNLYKNKDAIIELDTNLSKTDIYIGETTNLTVTTNFVQQSINSRVIHDTNYYYKKLGLKMSIYDSNGNLVNGASLMGVTFKYNGIIYYPQMDGTVRINIAPKIANISSKIEINTQNSNLPSDVYTIKVESFGSPDGIYFGLVSSDTQTINLSILNNIYGLSIDISDELVIIDKATGKTTAGNNNLIFNIDYSSGLSNPNLRISLKRRMYDEIYSTNYEVVDLLQYISNSLTPIGNLEKHEYLLSYNPLPLQILDLSLKENLVSGTYKITFAIYDSDNYIGEVYKYIIIK